MVRIPLSRLWVSRWEGGLESWNRNKGEGRVQGSGQQVGGREGQGRGLNQQGFG